MGISAGGFRELLPAVRSARRVGSSTGKAIARSTISCVQSDSDRIGVERVPVPAARIELATEGYRPRERIKLPSRNSVTQRQASARTIANV